MEKGSVASSSLSLLTDFYQLSMAYAYWKSGMADREASFHLVFRRPPFKGGFTVACGLEAVIDFIERFSFSREEIDYLSSLKNRQGLPYFESSFLDMLSKLQLTVTVYAVPEGSVVFPQEPLIRVEGPLLQCQLLESSLLNLINFPTLIATKAARICLAAQDDQVLEFGLRRAQGIDGALTASRAAYVGGCSATSNVLAGKTFGIPVQGTHAHSFIMAFDSEEEAFMAYAKALPDSSVFLVDTYNTLEGVKNAIKAGKWLESQGKKMAGIRLDSGDLAQLSIESRKLLDAAGFTEAQIVASNELDETIISELKRQGAKISVWGVGTNLVTAKDQPALDGVYKLSALKDASGKWKHVLKLSEQPAKVSNPGRLQVKRFFSKGKYVADVLYDVDIGLPQIDGNPDPFDPTKRIAIDSHCEAYDLLVPIFSEGRRVYAKPTLEEIRSTTKRELAKLPVGVLRFLNPHLFPVAMEKNLYELKVTLIKKIRKTEPEA